MSGALAKKSLIRLSLFTTRCIDSKLAALGVRISSTIPHICSVSLPVSSSSLHPQLPSQRAAAGASTAANGGCCCHPARNPNAIHAAYDGQHHSKKCNISLMTRCRFQIITTIIMSAASTLIDHEVRVDKCNLSLAMHTCVCLAE